MIRAVDHDGKLAGGHQLADEGRAAAKTRFLFAQGFGHTPAFGVAVMIEHGGKQIVGLVVHGELALPLGLEQIGKGFRVIFRRDQILVDDEHEGARESGVEVAFLIDKSRAEKFPQRRAVAHDHARFARRREKSRAVAGGVVEMGAGAVFGGDAVQRLQPAGGDEVQFNIGIVGFECANQLVGIFAIHRRVPDDLAFFFRAVFEAALAFDGRQAIDFFEHIFR